MNRSLGLGPILVLGLMMSPTAAFAGAWTLDAGQGQAIVTETFASSTKGFDGNGSTQPIARYNKDEMQALFEFGATNWLTLMLAPSLQHVDIAAPFEAARSGLGYTDVGARVRVGGGESWVFSLQSTLRVPGTFDQNNPAAVGYTDTEVDVRALLGYSFKAGAWPAFVDAQMAERFRLGGGGPPNEFRADFTLGVRPQDRWLVLLQSFNVISEGAGTLPVFPSYSYYKLQLSAVYEMSPKLSLQLGGYTTYWGQNALQENGLILGAWYKF
jgi:hypothetical protein